MGCRRFIFEMVYSAFNAEEGDMESRWINVCYFELVLVLYCEGFVNEAPKRYLEFLYLFLILVRSLGCRDLERHAIGLTRCMIPNQI